MLASCFAQGVCMCFVKGGLHIHYLHMITQGVCLCLLHALLRGPACALLGEACIYILFITIHVTITLKPLCSPLYISDILYLMFKAVLVE